MASHRTTRSFAALGLAALVLASCSSSADDGGHEAARAPATAADAGSDVAAEAPAADVAFYTQQAAFGSGTGGVLTLSDVDDDVLVVEDRPGREVRSVSLADFAAAWDETFGDDPPNAVLQFDGDEGRGQAVVELTSMDHDAAAGVVTYVFSVLHGDVPGTLERPTLVIDDAAPTGGITLVNQTGERVTLMLALPVDGGNAQPVVWREAALATGGIRTIGWRPGDLQVSAADAFGNETPRSKTYLGQRWAMQLTADGQELRLQPAAAAADSVEVVNSLATGTATAHFWASEQVAATGSSLTPRQMTTWSPDGTLAIGILPSGLDEGEVVPAQVLADATVIRPTSSGSEAGRITITGSAAGGYAFAYAPPAGG